MLFRSVWLDYLMSSGIIVTRDGKRFYAEGLGAIFMANAIAALPDPLATTVIADEKIWTERGTFRSLAPNPRLVEAGGTVFKAPTLDALAQMAGLDAIGLKSEIAAYNDAVRSDRTAALTPTRSTAKFKPYPIVEAPFYAFPACAGITYTMGGIEIGRAHV